MCVVAEDFIGAEAGRISSATDQHQVDVVGEDQPARVSGSHFTDLLSLHTSLFELIIFPGFSS